jgi:hopanoid-associated phosphorylase
MLGILCGFAAEKKVALKLSPLVAMSGAREERARAAAEHLVKNGARALLSFGVAGGLAKGLTAQSLIVGTSVVDAGGQSWACDTALIEKFSKAAPAALKGAVHGSNSIIGSSAEKERIHGGTRALIVDMESHIVAQTAARHGLPFAILRGVSDDADAPLPDAVLHGINEDGSENIAGVLKSLLADPSQLPSLLHFARNTNTALGCLRRAIEQIR